MPLQSSGRITLSQVQAEHGGPTTNLKATNYYRDPTNNPAVAPYVQNSNKSPPTYTTVTGYHPGTPGTCGRTCYTSCPQHCPSKGHGPCPPGYGGLLTKCFYGFNCGPGQKPSHSQYGGVYYCDPKNGTPAKPGSTYSYTVMHPGIISPANQQVPISGTIKWTDWYGSYRG